MSAILIISLDWRNTLLFYQVCTVLWGKEEFLYNESVSVLGRHLRFMYPPVSPQQCYEWGILQKRTLRNREVKPHDKRCTATDSWGCDSSPRLAPALHLLLYHSARHLWVEMEQPSKRACVCTHAIWGKSGRGRCRLTSVASFHKGIISWQGLCTFLMVTILNFIFQTHKARREAFRPFLYWFETSRHRSVLIWLFICLPTLCHTWGLWK